VAPVFNGSAQPSILYENLCFVPRASVAARVFYSQDSLETLTRLSAMDFDPEREAILAAQAPAEAAPINAEVPGHVEVVSHEPNTVMLRAELTRPGYVVLRDRFDPSWHATVDGREVTIMRADQVFRAVYVEAGRHEIRFYYRQAGLKAGLLISVFTLAGLGILFILDPPCLNPKLLPTDQRGGTDAAGMVMPSAKSSESRMPGSPTPGQGSS
jgi:hypothetical protein